MSAISTASPLLLLLLTMIILCETRRLSDTITPKEEPVKRSHLSSKKVDETAGKVPNISSAIAASDAKPAALSATAEETMKQQKGVVTEEKRVADHHETAQKSPRSSNSKKKHQQIKQQSSSLSSSSKGNNKSAGGESGKTSVSWRVPHNKKRSTEHEPDFNLDYSPPKTHPPSHN